MTLEGQCVDIMKSQEYLTLIYRIEFEWVNTHPKMTVISECNRYATHTHISKPSTHYICVSIVLSYCKVVIIYFINLFQS